MGGAVSGAVGEVGMNNESGEAVFMCEANIRPAFSSLLCVCVGSGARKYKIKKKNYEHI